MTKEIFNCDKCKKEIEWERAVWCNTCGVVYCEECAIGGFDDIELFDVSDEEGDVGIIAEECASCWTRY